MKTIKKTTTIENGYENKMFDFYTKTSERWNGCNVGQSGISSASDGLRDPQPYLRKL